MVSESFNTFQTFEEFSGDSEVRLTRFLRGFKACQGISEFSFRIIGDFTGSQVNFSGLVIEGMQKRFKMILHF